MRLNRKLLALAFASCAAYVLIHSLRGSSSDKPSEVTDTGTLPSYAGGAKVPLHLESWGPCLQSALGLLIIVASPQSEQPTRDRIRQSFRIQHIGQTIFFLQYRESADHQATVNEFHTHRDIVVNSHLERQDDLSTLQNAAAWLLNRCPQASWLLFSGREAVINPMRVIHAMNGVAAHTQLGIGSQVAPAGRCLLLNRRTASLVPQWPTTWSQMLSVKAFNATVRDATPLLCSTDGDQGDENGAGEQRAV